MDIALRKAADVLGIEDGVVMDRRLRKAADEGDVKSLKELFAAKPEVINSTTKTEKNTALHIAASKGHTLFVRQFLLCMGQVGNLMASQNIDGDTPMHLVVKAGHLEVVEHLLQYLSWARIIDNQDPTMMANKKGNTPLHDALLDQKLDVALKLLEANPRCAIIASENVDQDTPLHLAAKAGHLEVVCHLIRCVEGAREKDANLKDPTMMANKEGNTPLHDALFHRKLDVALKLLEANPRCAHAVNMKKESPLYFAAREGLVHVVKEIASQALSKASVSTVSTAVHQAVLHDSIRALEILLENIMELAKMTDLSGNNVLHYAAEYNRAHMVSILHKKIPTLAYKKNMKQRTPLHVAAMSGSIEFTTELLKQSLENIMELVEMTDLLGNNVLHYAAEHNRAHMVSMLHKKFPILAYKKNMEQHTPLHVTATYGSSECTTELLKQSPDTIGMVDIMGRNAFHIAAINGKVEVLELLLKCEVPDEILNQQDRDGNTPLHHAAKLCQRQPIQWLLNDPRINPLVINKDGHTAWAYQIPRDLVALIPRVLMDQALSNAIDKGDMLKLVNLLAISPDMVYSVTLDEKNTALHLAASEGNDWIVHHVLLYTNLHVGIITSENVDQDTPLHLAAKAGHLEVVRHLVSYVEWARKKEANLKEPLTMQNKKGNTPLHEAVVHGRYHVAVKLLEGAMEVLLIGHNNIKEHDKCVTVYDMLLVMRNGNEDTPLHLAVKVGDLELVNTLIKYAKVMSRGLTTQYTEGPMIMGNEKDNTPLHEAVLLRKSDIALKLLEANPRCGHMLNATKLSPLYIAVRDGLTHVVKKIASQGLSVASMTTDRGTALHQSVLANNIRSLEILLDSYVELVESTDSSGSTALHYAAQYNNARMVSMLLRKESTLAYKQNGEQHTPLCVAVNYGSAKAAKELLKQFPDAIEMVDIMGRNALHIAVIKDKVNMLELLLKYVLPEEIVNQQDIDGNTPLHHAASLYRRQSALVLLDDPRVNPSRINRDGDTAFALCGNQMNLWKELKVHKSRRCKQDQRVTLAGVLDRISLKIRAKRFKFAHDQVTTVDEDIRTTYVLVTVLVATLMSMVSFSVTFTMPGGYSRQSGTAIAGRHEAFKLFAVCNTITMCGSIVPVLCFLSQACCFRKGAVNKGKPSMLIWADRLIFLSGITMIMSMLIAVYLTIAPASWWVVSVVLAIVASIPFMLCLILGKNILRTNW